MGICATPTERKMLREYQRLSDIEKAKRSNEIRDITKMYTK